MDFKPKIEDNGDIKKLIYNIITNTIVNFYDNSHD